MTYEFTNEKVGSMKLENFHNNTGETFHIAGIDAQQPDANIIIGGINISSTAKKFPAAKLTII